MKRIRIAMTMLVLAITMSAQGNKKFDHKAYNAEQHQYIVEQAQLSQAEAAKFFAIYDELRAKERKLFDKRKSAMKSKQGPPQTDADCREAILSRDNTELELKKLQLKYHQSMLKVLPAKKVLDAILAAERFDQEKFRSMSRNGKGGMRPGKGKMGPGDGPRKRDNRRAPADD